MKHIFIAILCLILISCGDEEVKQSTDAKVEKTTKPLKEEKELTKQEELKIFKALPNNLGFEVSLIDEKTYSQTTNTGILLNNDTNDFKKVGTHLEIYNGTQKIFEFTDSINANEMPRNNIYDDVEFIPIGFYMINNQKWFRIRATGYENGYEILLPPPYNKVQGFSNDIHFSPSGKYLFDLFFTGLGGFQSEWKLYQIKENKLMDISSFNLDCSCANKEYSNGKDCPLCAEIIGEVKWISDHELLAKVRNYESMNDNKTGYIKIKIK